MSVLASYLPRPWTPGGGSLSVSRSAIMTAVTPSYHGDTYVTMGDIAKEDTALGPGVKLGDWVLPSACCVAITLEVWGGTVRV